MRAHFPGYPGGNPFDNASSGQICNILLSSLVFPLSSSWLLPTVLLTAASEFWPSLPSNFWPLLPGHLQQNLTLPYPLLWDVSLLSKVPLQECIYTNHISSGQICCQIGQSDHLGYISSQVCHGLTPFFLWALSSASLRCTISFCAKLCASA